MNKQILKLYKQAQEFAYKNISKESWNTDNFHAVVSGKFAELIVRECVQLCQECIDDGCVEAQEPMEKIKQHFGVEE